MKYLKRITLIFALTSLLLTIGTIRETYAKYKTDVTGTTNISIARWRILVNNQDIRNNSEATATITPTFLGTDNIKENVIAPTAEGYFDLIIDCSAADVSFNYLIETKANDTSAVTDLITTGYSINNGSIIPIENNASITNDITQKENPGTIQIRIYIKWDDTETATMDNTADTTSTINSDAKAKLDVTLSFKQIA